MPRNRSDLALALIFCVALGYALRLSAGDRGTVDWVVIGLVASMALRSLFRLGRRLHAWGGGRALWHLQRTLLFWAIGLLNTVLARPEEAAGWRGAVGWTMLALAVFDTLLLARDEGRARRAATEAPASVAPPS